MMAQRWKNLGLVPRAETSQAQIRVLQVFRDFEARTGYPPTLRELCAGTETRSANGMFEHVERLIRKGLLTRRDVKRRVRAVMLTDSGRALTSRPLPAGVVFLSEKRCSCGTLHFRHVAWCAACDRFDLFSRPGALE